MRMSIWSFLLHQFHDIAKICCADTFSVKETMLPLDLYILLFHYIQYIILVAQDACVFQSSILNEIFVGSLSHTGCMVSVIKYGAKTSYRIICSWIDFHFFIFVTGYKHMRAWDIESEKKTLNFKNHDYFNRVVIWVYTIYM